jgi:hypothetical protein
MMFICCISSLRNDQVNENRSRQVEKLKHTKVLEFKTHRIYGRKALDLGPKSTEFGTEKHRIWDRKTQNLGPKDLGPDFALPVFGATGFTLHWRISDHRPTAQNDIDAHRGSRVTTSRAHRTDRLPEFQWCTALLVYCKIYNLVTIVRERW